MQQCFPDYSGRKFRIEVTDREFEAVSYWSGGSKESYCFINTAGNCLRVPDQEHPYMQHYKDNRQVKLAPGLACVKHIYFCGHDMGLTLMLHPSDMPKLLP